MHSYFVANNLLISELLVFVLMLQSSFNINLHISFYHINAVTYSDCLGDQYTSLGTNSGTQKIFFNLYSFQLYCDKKYVEVASNDFIMHLIICKWLRM